MEEKHNWIYYIVALILKKQNGGKNNSTDLDGACTGLLQKSNQHEWENA